MKHIKSYRLFESKEFTIPEMLELGLLDWADVQHVAKSPMKIAELILELVEKSVEEGGEIDTLYRYLEKLSIKSNWLRSEILKDFGLSVAPERERLTRLLFDKYSGLEQVKRGNQLYWIDAEGLPVLRKFIGDSEVFVSHHRIWNLFYDIFGLKTSEVQEIIRKWLSDTYGLELEGVRPTIDLHGNRMPIE